jgi:hypothetical protein
MTGLSNFISYRQVKMNEKGHRRHGRRSGSEHSRRRMDRSRPGLSAGTGGRQEANKKAIQNWIAFSSHMAGLTGLEPATSGVTGRRCNRLYYSPRFYGIVALLELVGETGLEPVTLGL